MKFLTALSLLLIHSAPAYASATDLDSYLRDELQRIDGGVQSQANQALPEAPPYAYFPHTPGRPRRGTQRHRLRGGAAGTDVYLGARKRQALGSVN